MDTPQETGYQCEFVDNVKDYECPLCLHVTREPNLTSCCGQHFCHHCIQTALSSKLCPFCKEINFMAFLDKKQKRRVLDLKVYCKHKDLCIWKGSLGELEQHLSDECQLVSVNCSYNCGETIKRLFLTNHKTAFCPNRPHSCKHCQLEGTYQDIKENHIPVCPKYPVTCPNECEVSSLLRDQLEEHLRECPLAMVECELRKVGCEEKPQRKDLDRHMEEAARKHLTLSTNYFMKNQKLLANEIIKLKQDNEKLRKDLYQSLQQHQSEQEVTKNHYEKELSFLAKQIQSFKNLMYTTASVVTISVNYRELFCSSGYNHDALTSDYAMKINLRVRKQYYRSCLIIQVQSVMPDNLKLPKTCIIKVKLLNQAGDYHHHEVSGDNVYVQTKKWKSQLEIVLNVIENPLPGVEFIANRQIHIEISALILKND